MRVDDITQHIESCLGREHSNLPNSILRMDGMSDANIRKFLNALCSFPGIRYLEVGVWKGSTLFSALHGNRATVESAVAVDDWSEFGGPRRAFMRHARRLRRDIAPFRLIDGDAFAVDPADVGPVNIYLYDGDHEVSCQQRAFRHFDTILEDVFVALVDDWNWCDHKTRPVFQELGYTIHREWSFPWHNGFYIAVMEKGKTDG